MTTTYRVRVFCRDCYGCDPLGCFDGGYDYTTSDAWPYAVIDFATREEAEAEAARCHEAADGAPWTQQIVEVVDGVEQDPNETDCRSVPQ